MISTLYRRRKFSEPLYLDSSCVSFKYFALLSVCDKFELLGHVQVALMIWVLFSPFFLDSLLVTVSGFIGLFRSTCYFNLLCFVNFGVYPAGSTSVSFPVMRRWKCFGMKRLSQPSRTPGKRAEKLAEAKADVKRVTQNPGRVCFILIQKR